MKDIVSFDEFKKVDLRVANVKKVEDHPNADKLYVLTIDVGGEEKKIVAGLKKHYLPQELEGRQVIVVNNLAPAVLRGVRSDGMLLCARGKDTISVLALHKPVDAGSPIV